MPQKISDEAVTGALIDFVQESTDLRVKAYTALAREREWPSASTAAKRRAAKNFEAAMAQIAAEHGRPDVRYRWSTCNNGFKHGDVSTIYATIDERASGQCEQCEAAARRRAERESQMPTLAERHPHAVPWLSNPADADTKNQSVDFRCSSCEADDVWWSPERREPPRCHYCRTVGDAQPGDLIERRGGGNFVGLDRDVAVALESRHQLQATTDLGIVIPRGSLMIDGSYGKYPLPALKPDIVLPNERVAIEMDFDGRPGYARSHRDPDTVDQDIRRDQILNSVEWPVLRVRPPGGPTAGTWPRCVESTSRSPRVLAELIATAVNRGISN